jgi:hypothetical protein
VILHDFTNMVLAKILHTIKIDNKW